MAVESWGYVALEAEDGQQAVELFAQQRGAITGVICDVTMPRLNGWDTLTALRRLEPGIPVIMITGFDDEAALQPERREQPQALLTKPFELQELQRVLRATQKSQYSM